MNEIKLKDFLSVMYEKNEVTVLFFLNEKFVAFGYDLLKAQKTPTAKEALEGLSESLLASTVRHISASGNAIRIEAVIA